MQPQATELIPRFRVKWRTMGGGQRDALRAHAVLVIEHGRLNFETLCGRALEDLHPGYAPTDARVCRRCEQCLEPA